MFTRFENGWQLVKASAKVLQSDKKLIVFPIVSFILSIIVLISFAIPTVMAGVFDAMASSSRHGENARVLGTIIGFAYYLVMYFVVIFCNTALVGAVMIRMKGGTPTLGDGFKIATERIGTIFGYAAISATVGIILRTIAERGGIVGRIVSGLTGFVWSIATFLVIPVLVVENLNPIDAVKRSGELLKKTWGEQLAVNFGMGAIFGMLTLLVIIAGGALVMGLVSITQSVVVLIVGVVAIILVVIALGLVSSALQGIFIAALYNYATQGNTGGLISDEIAQGAFKQK